MGIDATFQEKVIIGQLIKIDNLSPADMSMSMEPGYIYTQTSHQSVEFTCFIRRYVMQWWTFSLLCVNIPSQRDLKLSVRIVIQWHCQWSFFCLKD